MRRAVAALAALAGCVPSAALPPGAAAPVIAAVPAQRPATPFRIEGSRTQGALLRGQAPDGTITVSLELPGQPAVPVPLDGRRFIIGLDRDAGPTATLIATLEDGRQVRETLSIAPRAWRIERIDAPYRAGRTTAEFDRLRPAELARIAAARAVPTQADGWRQPMRWPLVARVSGLFGAQRVYRGAPGSYHNGIDLAAPTGTPVRAPANGIVTLAADPAQPFTLEGNLLMVNHGAGLSSAFLHLSRIDVRPGDRVTAGQVIGAVGATGRATGPHLHWALRWRDARLDPLLVAGPVSGE
ncbi:MAG TPA: M23 family metallopeptidase [Sphingomonas sp.]|jgi:murein DD-endopeptidase MepM/ murein hydrolase activator NlpD